MARQVWREATGSIPPATLVFLDETSTHVTMTRTRGRAPRGHRVIDRVPRNHGQNMTCLTAISPTGIHAPCVFDGALDGPLFLQWVRAWLLPGLRRGTTIVLDNLSVHRNPAVRTAIEDAGCFCCSCQRTPPISTRSSMSSPSSRHICAGSRHAHPRPS